MHIRYVLSYLTIQHEEFSDACLENIGFLSNLMKANDNTEYVYLS